MLRDELTWAARSHVSPMNFTVCNDNPSHSAAAPNTKQALPAPNSEMGTCHYAGMRTSTQPHLPRRKPQIYIVGIEVPIQAAAQVPPEEFRSSGKAQIRQHSLLRQRVGLQRQICWGLKPCSHTPMPMAVVKKEKTDPRQRYQDSSSVRKANLSESSLRSSSENGRTSAGRRRQTRPTPAVIAGCFQGRSQSLG